MGAEYNGWAGIYFKMKTEEFDKMANSESKEFLFIDDFHVYIRPFPFFTLDTKIVDIRLTLGLADFSANNAQHASFDDDDWVAKTGDLDKTSRGKGSVPSAQLDLKLLNMVTFRMATKLADYDDADNAGVLSHDFLTGLLFDKSFGPHKILASVSWLADLSDDTKTIGNNDQDFDELGLSAAYIIDWNNFEFKPFFNLLFRTVFTKDFENSYAEHQGVKWSGGLSFRFYPEGITFLYLGLDLSGKSRANLKNYDGSYQAFRDLGFTIASDFLKVLMGERYLSAWAKLHLAFDEPYKAGVDRFARISPFELLEVGVNQRLLNRGDAYIGILLIYELQNLNAFYDTVTKNYVDREGKNSNVGLDHTIKFQLEVKFKKTWKTNI